MQNIHKLRIGGELRDKFEEAIIQQIKDAVAGASDRDSMFVDFNNYVEMLSPIQSSARWNGGSDLRWPLITKAHMVVKAQLIQQVKRDPKAMVSAIRPEDEDDAERQEEFISAKDHQCGLTAALADVINPTLTYPLGLMHVGWADDWEWRRTILFDDTETGETGLPEEL